MKRLKKNQIILSVTAIMLIAAGYLNYTGKANNTLATGTLLDSEEMASIGDATFVSSSATASENEMENEIGEEENIQTNAVVETTATEVNNSDESEYFTKSRLDRDKMYAATLDSYQKMIDSEQMSTEQKSIAQTEIQNINQEKNAVMITENLIKTKGFEDVVLFVNVDSISVIVKAEGLSEEEIAQIQNIVSRELKANVENIHISMK